MSRYQFTTKEHTVIVGWDRPLRTYFAQVWKGKPESPENNHVIPWVGPHPLLWLGTTWDDVPTVEDLAAGLRPHAIISAEILERLRADAANSSPPTAAQEAWHHVIRRLWEETTE